MSATLLLQLPASEIKKTFHQPGLFIGFCMASNWTPQTLLLTISLLPVGWSFTFLDFPIDLPLQKCIQRAFSPWLLFGKYHDFPWKDHDWRKIPVSPALLKSRPHQWFHSRDFARVSKNELPWGVRFLLQTPMGLERMRQNIKMWDPPPP